MDMADLSGNLDTFPGRKTDLTICLLGPPSVTWKGVPLSIPRRTVRAILFRLAYANSPVTRDHLHLLFWPDMPDAAARRNLSHHLTHLRLSLPEPELLVKDRDKVWLQSEHFWCDAASLRNATALHQQNMPRLRQLAAFYKGPFLEGFSLPGSFEFDLWSTSERAALERIYLEILSVLVDGCISTGDITRAITFIQKYLEIDELSEEFHQRLIKLYAASGERSAALQQYERCSSILSRELGIRPLPETNSIYRAVLNSDIRYHKFRTPIRKVKLPGLETRLVGRTQEMRQLDTAFSQAQSGQGLIVLISGEAGIGKTRLMNDFAHQKQNNALVLSVTAHPGQQVIPYRPIVDAIRILIDREKEQRSCSSSPTIFNNIEQDWLAEVSRLLPEIRKTFSDLPVPFPVEPASAQARLFDALCQLFLELAKKPPGIIFCLDDLQWTDQSTQAWLAYLHRQMSRSRSYLLILGIYRSEEAGAVAELQHNIARSGVHCEIKLEGLTTPAVLEMLKNWVGELPGIEMLADRLHVATGGTPFFLMEILRVLAEEDRLQSDLQNLTDLPLPESVREAIHTRLKKLSPKARQVLEAGAVLGQPSSIELLRRTSGRSQTEVVDGIDELISRQLLVEKNEVYAFFHDLIRRTVYENLSLARRQLLHQRAGEAYEKICPDAVSRIAYHYKSGADWGKALVYHQAAARGAQEIFAWEEAAYHQGKILAMMAFLDPDFKDSKGIMLRSQILAERAHSYFIRGLLVERDADLDELERLGAASGDDRIRLEAIIQKVRYLNLDGNYERSITTALQGLTLIENSQPLIESRQAIGLVQARLSAQIGFSNYFLGYPQEALAALEKAGDYAGESAGLEMRGRVLHLLGYVYFHLSDYSKSLAYQLEAYECFKEEKEFNRTAWAGQDAGFMYLKLGEYSRAKEYLAESMDLSQRIGALPALAFAITHQGDWHHFLGDYCKAIECYQQAAPIHSKVSSIHGLIATGVGLGMSCYHLGYYRKAHRSLHKAYLSARSMNQRRQAARALISLSLVEIAEGLLESAYCHSCCGIELAENCSSPEILAAGLITRATIERERRLFEKGLETIFTARGVIGALELPVIEMWLAMETGLLYLAMGRVDEAGHFTQTAVNFVEQANESWVPTEEAYLARARVSDKQNLRDSFDLYTKKAWDVINSKADKMPADRQRSRYLQRLAKSM